MKDAAKYAGREPDKELALHQNRMMRQNGKLDKTAAADEGQIIFISKLVFVPTKPGRDNFNVNVNVNGQDMGGDMNDPLAEQQDIGGEASIGAFFDY